MWMGKSISNHCVLAYPCIFSSFMFVMCCIFCSFLDFISGEYGAINYFPFELYKKLSIRIALATYFRNCRRRRRQLIWLRNCLFYQFQKSNLFFVCFSITYAMYARYSILCAFCVHLTYPPSMIGGIGNFLRYQTRRNDRLTYLKSAIFHNLQNPTNRAFVEHWRLNVVCTS